MKRTIAILVCTGVLAFAGERPGHRRYLLALAAAAFSAGNAADVATSFGGRELNPALGRGVFGARQAGINFAMGAGVGLTSWLLVRHQQEREAEVILFGAAAAHGAVAWHNASLRGR